MNTLRLGTRKSALAQAQAKWVAERLRQTFPELHVEFILITTSGDVMSSSPAATGRGSMDSPPATAGNDDQTGGLKALFTKEIEEALLENKIDLAVHSLKDMAADLPKGLIIGAVPEREDPRDVWISKTNIPFQQTPVGARIGTGAVRRQAQLRRLLPKAELVAMRGNVDTRLNKLAQGELDGIILALAGLKRLGREKSVTEILSAELMVPAVGQGCLGIEVRKEDKNIHPYLKALDHAASHAAAIAERSFLKALGGSCQTPIAAYARVIDEHLVMLGLVISPDGSRELRSEIRGFSKNAEAIGGAFAKKFLSAGADKILKGVIPE